MRPARALYVTDVTKTQDNVLPETTSYPKRRTSFELLYILRGLALASSFSNVVASAPFRLLSVYRVVSRRREEQGEKDEVDLFSVFVPALAQRFYYCSS